MLCQAIIQAGLGEEGATPGLVYEFEKDMRKWIANLASVLLAIPWWWILPALLSTAAVGSAAVARGVAGKLQLWFFVGSTGILVYAHYQVWIQRRGHQKAKWILFGNTLLVAYLWIERVRLWITGWQN